MRAGKEFPQQRDKFPRLDYNAGFLPQFPAGGFQGDFPRFGTAAGNFSAAGILAFYLGPLCQQDIPFCIEYRDSRRQMVRPLWEGFSPLDGAA